MEKIYKSNLTDDERKVKSFQDSINSFYSVLVIPLETAILSYQAKDGYEAGLKFIQDSLEIVKEYDEEKYESLKSELSLKIDSE